MPVCLEGRKCKVDGWWDEWLKQIRQDLILKLSEHSSEGLQEYNKIYEKLYWKDCGWGLMSGKCFLSW